MKKILSSLAIGTLLGATGVTLTADTIKPDPIILKQNVELHSRLNEPVVWDTSVATAEEISKAYSDKATELGVTAKDIMAVGGNVQTAIQVKLRTQGKMCPKI